MDITEFSRRIGVSPTTVSHAINGRGRISAATRQMVLQRMEELGYVPNLHAQQLTTGRSRMVVLHHTERHILSDMFLVEMARGIEYALHEHGYGLLLNTAGGPGHENSLLRRWVRSKAVDGVIVKSLHPVRDWVKKLAGPRMPFVVIHEPSVVDLPHVGTILVNIERSVADVAELFVKLGHQCIGFIGNVEPNPFLPIFRQTLQQKGVSLPEERVIIAGVTHQDGARAMRELLSQPSPPTAIFACTDVLALGAIHAATSMGVHVPTQLSVVGFDDLPLASMMRPPLTTIRVDAFQLGKSATEMLLRLLEQPNVPIPPKYEQTTLIHRDSVARAPQHPWSPPLVTW
jgi:LacI family transcriptional regulator